MTTTSSDLLSCSRDSDCTLVQVTCCPCSGGGQLMAVLVSQAEERKRMLDQQCSSTSAIIGGLVCPQAYHCDKYVRAECRNSRCRVVEASN